MSTHSVSLGSNSQLKEAQDACTFAAALQIPHGQELPHDRLMTMWRSAVACLQFSYSMRSALSTVFGMKVGLGELLQVGENKVMQQHCRMLQALLNTPGAPHVSLQCTKGILDMAAHLFVFLSFWPRICSRKAVWTFENSVPHGQNRCDSMMLLHCSSLRRSCQLQKHHLGHSCVAKVVVVSCISCRGCPSLLFCMSTVDCKPELRNLSHDFCPMKLHQVLLLPDGCHGGGKRSHCRLLPQCRGQSKRPSRSPRQKNGHNLGS